MAEQTMMASPKSETYSSVASSNPDRRSNYSGSKKYHVAEVTMGTVPADRTEIIAKLSRRRVLQDKDEPRSSEAYSTDYNRTSLRGSDRRPQLKRKPAFPATVVVDRDILERGDVESEAENSLRELKRKRRNAISFDTVDEWHARMNAESRAYNSMVSASPEVQQSIANDESEVESLCSMPSVESVDVPSLVSGTTLSSKQSDRQTARAVEELVAILMKDKEIKRLIDGALRKVALERFERNFTRLLKRYSKDLQGEASNSAEKKAVAFVRSHARPAAIFFTRQFELEPGPDGRNKLFDILIQQESERSSILELFLMDQDLPLGDSLIDPNPHFVEIMESKAGTGSQGSDSELDESEPEGSESGEEPQNKDTEGDETPYPNLERVREFLVDSSAFLKLRQNFHNFLYPSLAEKASTLALNKTEPGEQIAAIGVKVWDDLMSEHASPYETRALRGGDGMTATTTAQILALTENLKHSDALMERSLEGSKSIPVNHHGQGGEGIENLRENCKFTNRNREHYLHSTKCSNAIAQAFGIPLVQLAFRETWMKWKKFLRPEVRPGYRRIEWTCDCGQEMYGDFDNSKPEAINELLAALQNTAEGSTFCSVPMSGTSSSQQGTRAVQSSTSQNRSTGSALLVTNDESTPLPPPSSISASTTGAPDLKYLALCINTGEFKKSLAEIEVSKIASDGQLFELMKTKYREVRGFRARFSFLIKPVTIRFVHFNLFNLRGGYVDFCEMDKPWSIPPSDVRDYKYDPVPLKPLPPMPAEVFLHYLEYGNVDNVHRTSHWLRRLPIRLKARIIDASEIPVWGWGIYVIEGPNRPVIFWITMVTILASILAAILWSSLHEDVQGGTALGSLIIAMPTVVMAAFLFKLTTV